ncbi:MAG: tRNA uridine-5-carboxymethylaminomethyl(34) synthesis GTPase MnmE [Paludibacteraceae bacterium]|nr:tRNA uridine-5-carboxymethylaminomethyl(34) synthesis GTPase MnmE [Paludibacteraceae bacterium]
MTDTIAAVSTPYGVGGIAVVRMSGPQAITIAEKVLGKSLTRSLQFCSVPDLDDMVVSVFRGPHSFTGEDQVEFSCHGSLYIQQELLQRLIEHGARTATAGEFTKRAFLNGKMDLAQAEAVADIIASRSEAEKNMALSHLRGGISTEIAHLRRQLLDFTSLLELELDFSDHEDIEFADRTQLKALLNQVEQRLTSLVDSFKTGNALRQGVPVAIVGAANVGKSTLLNALLGDNRAIVSDIPGTTRDTIEDTLMIEGVLFRLIDTAGIRTTQDKIEQLGIERSRRAVSDAEIVLHLIDATDIVPSLPIDLSGKRVLRLYNKVDLLPSDALRNTDGIYISARQGDLFELKAHLASFAKELLSHSRDGVCISSARHYEALSRALSATKRVQQGLEEGLGGELLSMDLHDALSALGEISGEITSDEVLGNIFSKFCIGK